MAYGKTGTNDASIDFVNCAEEYSTSTLQVLKRCIDAVRSIPEFRAVPIDLRAKLKPGRKESFEDVRLYEKLENEGIVEQLRFVYDKITKRKLRVSETAFDSNICPIVNERTSLVFQVFIPLVYSLEASYRILDGADDSSERLRSGPPPTSKQTNHNKKSKSKNKPAPPPGLLSIQNYTDVAILLEWLVCSSILPLLQGGILIDAEKRSTYTLPRSMAGRIPRHALTWASEYQQKNHTPTCTNATYSCGEQVSGASIADTDIMATITELQTTVCAIGNLLLLDRFRPILLPRHVADLYAAIFQVEQYTRLQKNQRQQVELPCLRKNFEQLCHLFLLCNSSKAREGTIVVDTNLQARAFQTLLLHGTSSPTWLRRRVSRLLTELAMEDLASIVTVFVTSAPKDRTAASMRLARTLCTSDKASKAYYVRLCRQLMALLDSDSEGEGEGVLTVSCVLEQMPSVLVEREFVRILWEGLVLDRDNEASESFGDVDLAVRRITRLFSLPRIQSGTTLCRWLLQPYNVTRDSGESAPSFSILGQLLRISTMETVHHCPIKRCARDALDAIIPAIMHSAFQCQSTNGEVRKTLQGVDALSIALVEAVAISDLDLEGYTYSLMVKDDHLSSELVTVRYQKAKDVEWSDMVGAMGRRASLVIDLLVFTKKEGSQQERSIGSSCDAKENHSLQSRFFQLLLFLYFSSLEQSSTYISKNGKQPRVLLKNAENMRIAVMTMLPLLGEACSVESLLLGRDGRNLFFIIKMILSAAQVNWERNFVFGNGNNDPKIDVRGETAETDEHLFVEVFPLYDATFNKSSGLKSDWARLNLTDTHEEDDTESLLSIASLVLSLLVALLELGSAERTGKEEAILQSMMPILHSLSICWQQASRGESRLSDSQDELTIRAEIAEMASHAAALITARVISPTKLSNQDTSNASRAKTVEERLKEVENDAQSNQPPLRARAMVTLRHIVRGMAFDKTEVDIPIRGPLIIELEESTSSRKPTGMERDVRLCHSLEIAVKALEDKDSYVYLAAVQLIVTIADIDPANILEKLSLALRGGSLSCLSDYSKESITISLSSAQRVKIAEALMFSIRRRGEAAYQYFPMILNNIIRVSNEQIASNVDTMAEIQRQTHNYFFNCTEPGSDGEKDSYEECKIRISAGGPLFDVEENSIVRAACISMVAELLSVTESTNLPVYVPYLVQLGLDVLQLEASRPVRRSTALLCRELYSCLQREYGLFVQHIEGGAKADLSLGVAMVATSKEEALVAMLRRTVDRYDENAPSKTVPSSVVTDPAAVARCKEALMIRSECEENGAFSAAKIILRDQADRSGASSVAVVEKLLGSGSGGKDDSVTAMQGLKFDRSSLSFVG